jgi:Tol biopolymer transport system component
MRAGRLLTSRPALVAVAFVVGVALVGPVRAAAMEFKTPRLLSFQGTDQAQAASEPAFSADGAYVVFTGTFDGVSGVWRKGVASGELALVAGTDAADPALSAPDAGAPSVSADGRYVAFDTTAALDPADDPGGGCASVYVRDMSVPIGTPGAYVLASALNGSTAGLAYAGAGTAGCPGGGSAAAARVALSADGRYVAFTVLGESDLTTGPGGATTTPPLQVAVRDLATDTTTLVSQTLESLGGVPQPVPEGAAYADIQATRRQIGSSTAAISADGSTVAWMGIDIPAQAPASSAPFGQGDGARAGYPAITYAEPLWRRIADGPAAGTRRVTGGDDPLCGCAGPLATEYNPSGVESRESGLVLGTFIANSVNSGSSATLFSDITPQLSADGYTVAFLSTAPDTDQVAGVEAQHPLGGFTVRANAFVADMAPGLSRAQGLTRLTEWASASSNDFAADGEIEDIAISPDGTQVAFATSRTEFPLAPPALVTPSLQGGIAPQLYVADLRAGTLSEASLGYDGQPANQQGIQDPSFAGDSGDLVFASGATNLVYGAFNGGGSNVFLTEPDASPAVPGSSQIGAVPSVKPVKKRWELLLSAHRRADGSVVVVATVPGAGRLAATARAAVPTAGGSAAARGASGRHRDAVATRTIGTARGRARHAGAVRLVVKGRQAFRRLVAGSGGLFATISVSFKAAGHPTLHGKVQETFARRGKASVKHGAKGAAK